MSVIILLVIIGIVVAGLFLFAFIWAVRSGQYDDMYSPSVRILFDDTSVTETDENSLDITSNKKKSKKKKKSQTNK